MPKVRVEQVELELTLDQVLAIVRQLKPEEQELVRQAIESRPWHERLEALLARVWARVDQFPISEEEVDAEVERARMAIHTQSSG